MGLSKFLREKLNDSFGTERCHFYSLAISCVKKKDTGPNTVSLLLGQVTKPGLTIETQSRFQPPPELWSVRNFLVSITNKIVCHMSPLHLLYKR